MRLFFLTQLRNKLTSNGGKAQIQKLSEKAKKIGKYGSRLLRMRNKYSECMGLGNRACRLFAYSTKWRPKP
jgi:hypothetical protein